jgi:hypothetical protein
MCLKIHNVSGIGSIHLTVSGCCYSDILMCLCIYIYMVIYFYCFYILIVVTEISIKPEDGVVVSMQV